MGCTKECQEDRLKVHERIDNMEIRKISLKIFLWVMGLFGGSALLIVGFFAWLGTTVIDTNETITEVAVKQELMKEQVGNIRMEQKVLKTDVQKIKVKMRIEE